MLKKLSLATKMIGGFVIVAVLCGAAAGSGDLEKRVAEFRGEAAKDAGHPAGGTAEAVVDSHNKAAAGAVEAPPKAVAKGKSAAGHGGKETKGKVAAAHGGKETAASGHGSPGMSPGEALKALMAGNGYFVAGKFQGPNRSTNRRESLSAGQKPFAIIVGCSDSRVPPELLFDRGLGDIFVIRTAGHVVDNIAIGSIEYAVEHLGANLIVVLGHKRCGAVAAAVQGGEPHGHIGAIVKAIAPSVEKAKRRRGDALANSVRMNIRTIVDQLVSSPPVLSVRAEEGTLKIVGAHYDIDSGAVTVTYDPCDVNDNIL